MAEKDLGSVEKGSEEHILMGSYWDECSFRNFRGKLLLPIYGFNLWFNEADSYSRMNREDISIQVIVAECQGNSPYSGGERLILRVQDFKAYLIEALRNKDKENEVSIWLSRESAIKLKRFLSKMYPESLADLV